ncbi:uncharacterized protein LOC128965720 [Oppia nitens]|uniref:uncharacterized protein LOC128965720 n=1 Tax=Oppia nitens TaxID=1686743 RepID=UPI0023DAA032|nr:uncharacterized protein LOC128965720 [Oppia nitens]
MESNVVCLESENSEEISGINCISVKENIQTNGQSIQTTQRHRFKVVKLVSSEPYGRGRWNCRDFEAKDEDIRATDNCKDRSDSNQISIQNNIQTNSNSIQTNQTVVSTAADAATGVAIDNKIEQAMDLVKSHLMFAVREEVDVLKERIKELEAEIEILRSHASSDVLQLVLQNQIGGQVSDQTDQQKTPEI